MVAAVATLTGAGEGISEIARLARETIDGWLREYEGYRGLIILTDEGGRRAQVMTLWDTHHAEAKARHSRGAMRDQIAAMAGMDVEGMDVYDVPVLDVVAEPAGD